MARHGDGVIFSIGLFKLLKALVLIAIGIAAFSATPRALAHALAHGLAWLGAFPGKSVMLRAIGHLRSVGHQTAELWGALSLAYAAVFLVEGVGLLLRKRWAEWLTVFVTASFVPIEIYEIVVETGASKVVALVLNVAIVIYLIWRHVSERGKPAARVRRVLRLA